jgi:hypothetical protein
MGLQGGMSPSAPLTGYPTRLTEIPSNESFQLGLLVGPYGFLQRRRNTPGGVDVGRARPPRRYKLFECL